MSDEKIVIKQIEKSIEFLRTIRNRINDDYETRAEIDLEINRLRNLIVFLE